MINLSTVYQRYIRRTARCELSFTQISSSIVGRPSHAEWYSMEGILSQTWQAWCLFCRQTLVGVGIGHRTRSGIAFPAVVSPATWERVSYVSKQARNGRPIRSGIANNLLRREPTWGDLNVIHRVLNELGSQRASQLQSMFGSIPQDPLHIQTVRNAAAHLNAQTLAEVQALRVSYDKTENLRHPLDATLWRSVRNKQYAYYDWVDQLRIVADLVTA